METQTAIVWVKAMAILHWVSAAFGILIGLLYIVMGFMMPSMMSEMAELEGEELPQDPAELRIMALVFGILGVIIVIASLLSVWIGWGLWSLRNWARIVLIVITWLEVVIGVLYFVVLTFAGPLGWLIGIIFGLPFLAICGGILWLFQFDPTVKGLFVPARQGTARAASAKR